MSDLALVRSAIASLTTRSEVEQVVDVLGQVDGAKKFLRDLEERLNDALMEWLRENGSFETETTRYYLGTEKRTTCNDKAAALEAILTATSGDIGALVNVLSAQPFKHGAARELGPEVAQHFRTVEVEDIKTGKPVVKVQAIPANFRRVA